MVYNPIITAIYAMIIQAPNEKLNTRCTDVLWPEAKVIQRLLLNEVRRAKEDAPADIRVVGLAAPQIGRTVRAFTAFGHIFINPVINYLSKDFIDSKEGCLSLSNEVFENKRHRSVGIMWFNIGRQLQQKYFHNDAAVIIQHEMDHLNGKLCNE